jgi:hypothetical protein
MAIEMFNRIFVLAAVGLVAVIAGIVALAAMGILSPGVLPGWPGRQLAEVDALEGASQTRAVVFAAAVMLLALLVVYLELRDLDQGDTVALEDVEGNRFSIRNESLARIVAQSGLQVPGVRRIKPQVLDGEGGLLIRCEADLQSSERLPEVGSELRATITRAVEDMTGSAVSDVRLHLRYEPQIDGRHGY